MENDRYTQHAWLTVPDPVRPRFRPPELLKDCSKFVNVLGDDPQKLHVHVCLNAICSIGFLSKEIHEFTNYDRNPRI
jgi:hypothetical protein